jgi:hypothetical protein
MIDSLVTLPLIVMKIPKLQERKTVREKSDRSKLLLPPVLSS